jgi:hypothetical protein
VQPISPTLINSSAGHSNHNQNEEEIKDTSQTESSQILPVYSSDNHGVNSIIISKRMENREFIIPSNKFQVRRN